MININCKYFGSGINHGRCEHDDHSFKVFGVNVLDHVCIKNYNGMNAECKDQSLYEKPPAPPKIRILTF